MEKAFFKKFSPHLLIKFSTPSGPLVGFTRVANVDALI